MPAIRNAAARAVLLAVLATGVPGCSSPGNDGAEQPAPLTGTELGSKNFLQFLNRQPSLAAGRYALVAATGSAGQGGAYALRVRFDDGRIQNFSGNWVSSGGADPLSAQNPRHLVELDVAGGLDATLTSTADAVLYLLDANGDVVAQDDDSGGGSNARIVLAESRTDSVAYAQAYYAAIDPDNARDTLTRWKQVNGFDAGDDAKAVFLDRKDLGYGRNMHMKRGADGSVAFYVDNYQIENVPGQNYSAINLDAAVGELRQFHIGTNAIEYGPIDADGDGTPDDLDGDGNTLNDRDDWFVRFYTFSPTPPYQRLLAVDMDDQGAKAMPVPCITCHGGRADPLLPDGAFARAGDTRGHLQSIDLDALGFSTQAGATREELHEGLRAFNCEVYRSYAASAVARPGQWNSGSAREMLFSWYGADPCDPAARFDNQYVPPGWVHDPITGFPPAGSEQLYRDVVADNCRTCHILRGTSDNSEIDFTSFEKFIGHAAEMVPLVYDSGRMPLALVPYRNFYDAPGVPEQLASFLPDFDRVAAGGAVLRPGRAVANAGPDRRSPSPVTVSGSASRSAQTYAWRIVSRPPGAVATLDRSDAARAVLTADLDGAYELELVVANALGRSVADRVTVTIDAALSPAPSSLRFETDIKPVLQGDCVSCHTPGGNGSVLPPVVYTTPAMGENRDLYAEVRARVDLRDPAASPLLTKPAGRHHNGGQRPGFDATGDDSRYRLFLDWILEGAPR